MDLKFQNCRSNIYWWYSGVIRPKFAFVVPVVSFVVFLIILYFPYNFFVFVLIKLNMFIKFKSVLLLSAVLICVQTDKIEDPDGGYTTSNSYTVHCAQRKEISPCTCHQNLYKPVRISVECQKMKSFEDIINTLRNKFERSVEVHLVIEFSNLEDLPQWQFKELHSTIYWIWLRTNEMGG